MDERFWSKVDKTAACWLWTGSHNYAGYGKLREGAAGSRTLAAHRVSWELSFGPIPEGMCVCHRCDNPPCVRPDHLFLGTLADNTHDMVAKTRNFTAVHPDHVKRGSQNGNAKLTEEAVRDIRERYAHGESMLTLAHRYSVSDGTISLIVNGRTWRHA